MVPDVHEPLLFRLLSPYMSHVHITGSPFVKQTRKASENEDRLAIRRPSSGASAPDRGDARYVLRGTWNVP